MTIKRSRQELEFATTIAMANYLIHLSRSSAGSGHETQVGSGRVFECKTCNKQFPSFQALGGHRASHKKPKLSIDTTGDSSDEGKAKTHECSICGLEFGLGQALGGHMRRHRFIPADAHVLPCSPTLRLSIGSSYKLQKDGLVTNKKVAKKVVCVDLNLTPSENLFLETRQLAPVF